MPEVDTSSYPKVQPGNKLLGGLGELTDVANAMQQNKLLRLREQQGGIDLQKAGQDLAAGQVNSLYSAYGSLVNGGKPITHEALSGVVNDWIRQGRVSPGVGATILREIPADPKAIRDYAIARYTSTLPPEVSTVPTQTGVTEGGAPVMNTRGRFIGVAAGAGGEGGPAAATTAATKPAATSGVPAAKVAQGGVVTTLPKGEGEAMEEAGRRSGAAVGEDRLKARTFKQDMFPLEASVPLIEKLGQTGTGPGSETWNTVRSAMLSLGVPGNILDIAEKTKNYDELHKYLMQNVMRNGDTSSNDKLFASITGNPNISISNAALGDLAKAEIAQRRLRQAQVLEFDRLGTVPDAKYGTWAASFNTGQDLRAFAFDLMSPEMRAKLVEGLKGKEREKFIASLRLAVAHGLVADPRSAANAK